MLHFGEQNRIARTNKFFSPGLRDKVDAFGGAARKHDLIPTGRADVTRHALAGAFVSFGGAVTQEVKAAMDISVFVFVIISERLNHRSWLLGCGGAIEVNQRMPVRPLPKDRKILSNGVPIDDGTGRLVHAPNLLHPEFFAS